MCIKHHDFPVPDFKNESGKFNFLFSKIGTKSLFPKMCSRIPGKNREIKSLFLSVCLSVCLGLFLFLSFVHPTFFLLFVRLFSSSYFFLCFFFSSRISRLNGKFIIFLVPEIRDENENFL